MLYKLWVWIQLWIIPFGWLVKIHNGNNVLPEYVTAIKLANGRKIKTVMITTDYGILFSEEKYVDKRLQKLLAKQKEVSDLNVKLTAEINDLSLIQREYLINRENDNV